LKKRGLAVVLALLLCGSLALLALRFGRDAARPAAATLSLATASARVPIPYTAAEVVYDGKLAAGWEDWGWGPHKLGAGPAAIRFERYGGIIFHHLPLESPFGALVFRYKAPLDWTDFLTVQLKSRSAPESAFPTLIVSLEDVASVEDGWREVLLDFTRLDPTNAAFDRIVLTARKSVSKDDALLDKVVLTERSGAAASTFPVRPVQLSVSCSAPTHRINPNIYGGTMSVWDAAQTGQRVGGNPVSRLNWDANVWNTGADWFFENGKAAGVQQWLRDGKAHQVPTALVVPLLGWVAKDALSVGFPKAKFAQQRKFDPNRSEAGDGFRSDGTPITPLEPSQTSVPAPPELIGRWVRTLREQDLARAVSMYILDNEPALWSVNHRDVHPDPVGYDELLDRTLRYGSEIRRADPDAVIAGPAEWGFSAYSYSAKDLAAGPASPDRKAHGDVPLIPWYLRELAQHEKTTGTRILDVLDVHFYPAAAGVYGTDARTDAAGAALRLRSTRALWDPTYRDESWIDQPVKLIPRLKEWVASNYPGRLISLGEWSFGADGHISGGLATAEALGRFGQQGLDSAFFWGGPNAGTPAFWAFRAYRNFDGKGGRFQDLSIPTREGDNVSFFASRDEANTEVVAIVINRDPTLAMRTQVALPGCGEAAAYRAFSYGPGSTELKETSVTNSADGTVTTTVAPYSFTVLDIRLKR
jgi:hypothetical protein